MRNAPKAWYLGSEEEYLVVAYGVLLELDERVPHVRNRTDASDKCQ